MKRKQNRLLGASLVTVTTILASLVVFGCSQPAAPPVEKKSDAVPQKSEPAPKKLETASLRLDWLPFGYQAPFFLAYEKGWYTDEGIALFIGDGSGSSDAVKLAGAGRDTFGFAQGTELVRGVSQEVPAKMIALIQRKNPTIFTYHDGLGIEKPKDLEGKTMGGSPEDLEDPAIRAFAAVNGVDLSKVKVKTIGPPLKASMMGQKQFDFIETHITNKAAIEQKFGLKLGRFLLSDYGLDGLVGYGILASNTVIEKNPGLVRGFVAATLKAWEYAEKNPDEAIAALLKHKPDAADPQGLKEVLPLRDTKRTQGKPWGYQSPEDWQDTIDILAKYGNLKTVPKASDVFTNDFLPKK